MSSPPLEHRLVYGLSADVADNVHYADDGSIIYPAGHTVVAYQNDGRLQRFLVGSPESECITALAISPNKKLLAVAEKADKATITVYDLATLKKRKFLKSTEANSKEYVSISFSSDGKHIIAQAGAPEWLLLVWLWDKHKVVVTSKTATSDSTRLSDRLIYQCSCNPFSPDVSISLVGKGVFKTLKLLTENNSLKQLPFAPARREGAALQFTCQAWLGEAMDGSNRERQLLGTGQGEILQIEGSDVRATLDCDNGRAVTCLAVHSKGFIAGQDGGIITVFERDDKDSYKRMRSLDIKEHCSKVRSIAVSPNEDQLAVTLESGQMFTLSLINMEIMKAHEMNFSVLTTRNHSSRVDGMSICTRRPIIATCSADCTVRLWNYMERCDEAVHSFQEAATSIALHPSGHLVAVGFSDKLRLMSVLLDDLKQVKDFAIKGCKEVAFSNGGQFFAAVNGTTVSVYNTWTGENVGNLRGHSGKVKSIWWEPDDSKLVSAGLDGAVYEWRLCDLKREKESVMKSCAYSCVTGTPDGHSLYATGVSQGEHKLKELEDVPGTGMQVVREYNTGEAVTQIILAPNSKMLLAGTDTGAVRCYKWPPLNGEYSEVKVHAGAITRLCMSNDETLLFSCGEDGAVCVMDIGEGGYGAKSAAAKREVERLPFAEEVLVARNNLQDDKQHTADLEQRVSELTLRNQYDMDRKDMEIADLKRILAAQHAAEMDVERAKAETLAEEKMKQEADAHLKLQSVLSQHTDVIASLEAGFQQRMMQEMERYQNLLVAHEAQQEEWQRQNAVLLEGHATALAQLTQEQEARVAEAELRCSELQQELEQAAAEQEEMRHQLEEDADAEIQDMKAKYEQKLQEQTALAMKSKGEYTISKKRIVALQKDIEAHQAEAQEVQKLLQGAYDQIRSLEKEVSHYRQEMRDRDAIIDEKEKRIFDLKRRIQDLEKSKFVLQYKNDDLKSQVEPRDMQIGEMRSQIQDMDGELARYHKNNAGLDLLIHNMRLRQAGLQAEVASQVAAKQAAQETIKRMQHDLAMVGVVQDPKQLKEKVNQLYSHYCTGTGAPPETDKDVELQYSRQRDYLERTIDGLKRKMARDGGAARAQQLQLMSDNCALLREVNELRREVKKMVAQHEMMRCADPRRVSRTHPAAPAAGSSGGKGSLPRVGSGAQRGSNASTQQLGIMSVRATRATHEVGFDDDSVEVGLRREIEMQREMIAQLREALAAQQQQQQQGEQEQQVAVVRSRPVSGERLAPLAVTSSGSAAAVVVVAEQPV